MVPDEGGRSVLHTFVIVHGVVAPRVIGAAALRDAADNDDDLWLCVDGCTHHSDHLSISQRTVLMHPPACFSFHRKGKLKKLTPPADPRRALSLPDNCVPAPERNAKTPERLLHHCTGNTARA